MNQIILGDSLQILKGFADNTFDAAITDPPYSRGEATKQAVAQTTGKKYTNTK